jgi:hypothetical protein
MRDTNHCRRETWYRCSTAERANDCIYREQYEDNDLLSCKYRMGNQCLSLKAKRALLSKRRKA